MDKLSAMATFVTVAEAGNFTRAADVLGLPKSRVSQRVADLERHLGVRLFNRTTRAMNLTEDGKAYLAKCQDILHEVEELEGALRGGALEPKGRLRVEALSSIARWVIAPKLHEFQALYPGLDIRLGGSDRVTHLLEDGIDCAIRGGQLEDAGHIARHACDVRVGLYAAPSYLRAAGPVQHPRDLVAHRRLSWFSGQRAPFAWRLEAEGEICEPDPSPGLQFDDHDVAIASCAVGAGICPGAPFAVAHLVRAGALAPVLPHWSFAPRPIHILYPSNKHLSPRVRCFVDWSLALLKSSRSVAMTPLTLAEDVGGEPPAP